jgi:hypothetical protein
MQNGMNVYAIIQWHYLCIHLLSRLYADQWDALIWNDYKCHATAMEKKNGIDILSTVFHSTIRFRKVIRLWLLTFLQNKITFQFADIDFETNFGQTFLFFL